RFDDIGSPTEPTVDYHFRPAGYRGHHFRQNLHGSAALVKLTAPMVRNIDGDDATFASARGIIPRRYAFQHELDLVPFHQALEIVPGKGGLIVFRIHSDAPRLDEVLRHVPLAPPRHRRVHRHAYGFIASVDAAFHAIVDPFAIATGVELK